MKKLQNLETVLSMITNVLTSNVLGRVSMNLFFLFQLFVFTDGEVSDTYSVIREVKLNSKKHRYEESVVPSVLTVAQAMPHVTCSTCCQGDIVNRGFFS